MHAHIILLQRGKGVDVYKAVDNSESSTTVPVLLNVENWDKESNGQIED